MPYTAISLWAGFYVWASILRAQRKKQIWNSIDMNTAISLWAAFHVWAGILRDQRKKIIWNSTR